MRILRINANNRIVYLNPSAVKLLDIQGLKVTAILSDKLNLDFTAKDVDELNRFIADFEEAMGAVHEQV